MARRVAVLAAAALGAVACAKPKADPNVPPPTIPLPTAVLAGQRVTLYPLTLVAAVEELQWNLALGSRAARLATADSLLAEYLKERAPEATWVLPDELRRHARQAPGMLGDPDQMGTAVLRDPKMEEVPDPLRSQMRNLTGVAGDRWALAPASLVFTRTPEQLGRAELSIVLIDVRNGLVRWRTVATGEGSEPWAALRVALGKLLPINP
jgi:hypothetical protein